MKLIMSSFIRVNGYNNPEEKCFICWNPLGSNVIGHPSPDRSIIQHHTHEECLRYKPDWIIQN
jgi:hypothetical protein